MTSLINHPPHYNQGRFEVIEIIEDQKLGFHRGNAIKYICRAGKKDQEKEIEDLEKAAWYLRREIECLRAAKESRTAIKPNDMNPPRPFISATAVSSLGTLELPPGTVGIAPK